MTIDAGPSSSLDTSSLFFGPPPPTPHVQYRLYKRRFSGLISFVCLASLPYSLCLLSLRYSSASSRACHGPGSVQFQHKVPRTRHSFVSLPMRFYQAATAFAISVDKVNWLSNIVCCIYIPVSLLVPVFCSRFGITRCVCLHRISSLSPSLPPPGSTWHLHNPHFWLDSLRRHGSLPFTRVRVCTSLLWTGSTPFLPLFVSSHPPTPKIFSAIAQPVFQVLGPMYSEKWFDLKGRTSATMIIAIGLFIPYITHLDHSVSSTANPIGSAIGQLLAPLCGSVRESVSLFSFPSPFFTHPAVPLASGLGHHLHSHHSSCFLHLRCPSYPSK